MDKLLIEGGYPLEGEIIISGAKNAVLPLMAACILTDGVNFFTNVPDLKDVHIMRELLNTLGAKVEFEKGRLIVDTSSLNEWIAPYEIVKAMRASILVMGPLLARFGRVRVSFPGGCLIGDRPVEQHLKGFRLLGAEIRIKEGYIEAKAKKLRGTTIPFDVSTVTGTENIMMAATLAQGETIILNAACEPEIVELANVLEKMGANIKGVGTDIITINGVNKLSPINKHDIIPDRIEAGTFMIAAAITNGNLILKKCCFEHCGSIIGKLIDSGAQITKEIDGIKIQGMDKIKSVDVTTLPYPGFPTDLQAPMMALMSISDGISIIKESIFPQRFTHIGELRRMGAEIKLTGSSAVVRGVQYLTGVPVIASDIRAGAALVLAGLASRGKTEISDVHHIDRGYEHIESKLEKAGAKLRRIRF